MNRDLLVAIGLPGSVFFRVFDPVNFKFLCNKKDWRAWSAQGHVWTTERSFKSFLRTSNANAKRLFSLNCDRYVVVYLTYHGQDRGNYHVHSMTIGEYMEGAL